MSINVARFPDYGHLMAGIFLRHMGYVPESGLSQACLASTHLFIEIK